MTSTTRHRPKDPAVVEERERLSQQIDDALETPMVVLGFVWLLLMVIEFTQGLSPFLLRVSHLIWALFVAEFIFSFTIAPAKLAFFKRQWLTALALAVPALRMFRIVRAVRLLRLTQTTRGFRLLRVISSLNRGMQALRASFSRRGFGYVMMLTLIVAIGGAAGMYAFESAADVGDRGFRDFSHALWWTAMILVTMGSEYWPRTPEGRILCLLLAIYGFAVFGYVTATVATFFVERDSKALTEERSNDPSKDPTRLAEELSLIASRLKQIEDRLPPQSHRPIS